MELTWYFVDFGRSTKVLRTRLEKSSNLHKMPLDEWLSDTVEPFWTYDKKFQMSFLTLLICKQRHLCMYQNKSIIFRPFYPIYLSIICYLQIASKWNWRRTLLPSSSEKKNENKCMVRRVFFSILLYQRHEKKPKEKNSQLLEFFFQGGHIFNYLGGGGVITLVWFYVNF